MPHNESAHAESDYRKSFVIRHHGINLCSDLLRQKIKADTTVIRGVIEAKRFIPGFQEMLPHSGKDAASVINPMHKKHLERRGIRRTVRLAVWSLNHLAV